ncbi:hypothetical protein MHT86_05680 [Corynebacterium mastitidis]|uniref:Secreted protein n=1 Tax=Corynebacterium mastitidis TaxID=161890 RepID=A0A2N0X8F1_9CORY|nr:hypothetical protein [Corynebacterium mastitidis]MCH6196987.1 hypothetical protein [Corynebacterium mastitidis]PKF68983.1 hypothetical protein CXB45_03885 [Corynebacterium mastitidis]
MIVPERRRDRALLRPLSLAATAGTLALHLALPAAQADVLPLSPTSETTRDAWVNPLVRAGEGESPVRVELLSVENGTGAHLHPGEELRLRVRVRNVSEDAVAQPSLQVRRGAEVSTVAEARQALALDSGAYPQALAPVSVGDSLRAGEERTVELRAATGADGLGLVADAAYPAMVAASGLIDGVARDFGTERLVVDTLTTRGADDASRAASALSASADAPETADPQGISLLYPLSEPARVAPGETGEAPEAAPLLLEDDSLARSLASGGRLHSLLTAYERAIASSEVAGSTCLALDPALISTVDRMQEGYSVVSSDYQRHHQGSPARRLRDSWGVGAQEERRSPGAGTQAAQSWLHRLRGVAEQHCVVALPWANADLNAVQRTANPWLMREALQRGQEVITRVVGAAPQRGVVIPDSGYVSEATAASLGWAGQDGTPEEAWEAEDSAASEASAAPESSESPASPASRPSRQGPQGSGSTLDSPSLPDNPTANQPHAPQHPVSVLVADNTVWSAPEAGRFAQIHPGIRAVTYPASLSATLASTGSDPATVGYSNPEGRFDPNLDSALARRLTAAAAVRLATEESRDAREPMLMVPPAGLDAAVGTMLLEELESALSEDRARPMSLSAYLSPSEEQESDLRAVAQAAQAAQTAQQGAPNSAPRLGAPFLDPAVYSDAEVLRTTQQANYTDDLTGLMVNDPGIALTRYAFTAPLRQDLLAALSTTRRRGMAGFSDAVADTSRRLEGNREVLQELRGSVTLLPPGNVYTRTSDSSPLLIVAKNGLPLPVDATMRYHTEQEATITVPRNLRIPARGSITVQMTADIPGADDQAQMDLWLASSDGSAISSPVRIAVNTRAGLVKTSALIAGLGALLVAGTLFRLGRRRRGGRTRGD